MRTGVVCHGMEPVQSRFLARASEFKDTSTGLTSAVDMKNARVIDYKTGRLNRNMADVVVKGGSELQRCLYAFAVKSLLGTEVKVEAALLYPGVTEGEQALFPLSDVDAVLDRLATAIKLARRQSYRWRGACLALTRTTNSMTSPSRFLPARFTCSRKMPLAKEQLGEAAKIWDAP